MRTWHSVFCLGALLLAAQSLGYGADDRQVQLRWAELGPRVTGHKVALVLPDGTRIEGRARGVDPEGLRLKVSKTSNRTVLSKGEQLVPRASVSLLQVTEYRKTARLVVTTGAIAAAAGIAAATYPDIYGGSLLVIVPTMVAAGVAGSGVAGYFIGKRLDRRIIEIRILP